MDLDASLRSLFGFPGFRPGQREACEAALADRDVMVVMPTGSGKSLCYQLPALLRDDLTVVVSPLVALMQDQVEALAARGLGDRVALVNAQRDGAANAATLRRAAAGELRLLYVAPERFAAPRFLDAMAEVRVGLFVVDEAHCVSQWGHDFRPDYFRLADAARMLGARALVASTATATPRVAHDVVQRLGLRDPLRVATGFDRPNIAFAVARPAPGEKRGLLAAALKGPDALPAIFYSGTRAGSEELSAQLGEALGVEAAAYHAGLDRETRATGQRRFLADELQVICATNAFGMGVDKPNVRTVVHASVPASLEAYYQEAGRAGRDGRPARALVISPSPSAPDRVAGRAIARFDRRAAALCKSSVEEGARARWRQYREIWAYVEQESCRREAILRHFGDASQPVRQAACCDVCTPGLVPTPPPPDPVAIETLDDAIISVATGARPAVGRTTCAEILHGGRSKKLLRNAYDGLPAYGVSSHMRRAAILARVDGLIEAGPLETSGGAYPVLRLPLGAVV